MMPTVKAAYCIGLTSRVHRMHKAQYAMTNINNQYAVLTLYTCTVSIVRIRRNAYVVLIHPRVPTAS